MTLMSIPDICPSLAHKTAGCGHRSVRTSLPLLWLYHTRERPAPASDVAQAWKGAALSATPDRVAECRGRGERRGSTGLNRFHRIGFHDYGQFHSWGYIAGAMVSRVRNSRGRPKSASNRLDVEINYDGFVVAAHKDTFQRLILARINFLMRNE